MANKLVNVQGAQYRTQSNHVNSLALLANVSETQAIPSGYNIVFFSCTANCFINVGGNGSVTAAVPTDTSDGTASELAPNCYILEPEDTHIAIISPKDCYITMAYYRITQFQDIP